VKVKEEDLNARLAEDVPVQAAEFNSQAIGGSGLQGRRHGKKERSASRLIRQIHVHATVT
jgi:hypothetical protein